MAKSFIEKLREQREKRVAANKAMANREQREFLNTEHLPKGVKLWWAKDGAEVRFRVLPFIVTKAGNCAGEAVDSFSSVRRFKVHYLPNGRVVVCPNSFGAKTCPLCKKFYDAPEKERKNRKSPIQQFKPKDRALFNALFEVANEDGVAKKVMCVVNAGYFASWEKLMTEVKAEAGMKQNAKFQDKIYNFDDPEEGYWIEARCNKASISGNDKDAFMQFTKVSLEWKADTEPLPDKVYDKLTDLDLLIPEPPSVEELKKLMGIEDDDEVPEEEDADTSEEVEDLSDDAEEEDTIPMGKVADTNTKAHKAKQSAPAPVEEETAEEPEAEPEIEDESESDDNGFDDDDFDF